MLMTDIIKKKRNGMKLDREEIQWVITEYVRGNIPDYQVSALMMAIYYMGLDNDETLDLTMAMKNSGDVLDLSGIKGIKVDKHSTGGVGDKTSLIVAPMVAALGIPVAKMSGRGLGHTGGTIDKLESIKGFRTDLTEEEFINNVNTIGISIMGQTRDLAPADKKLYALRDVTGTVENMSLIASSIMSKKLAAGCDGIVLDVTCGSGAFMKNIDDARALARIMVDIGNLAGKKTVAVITDMNEPLGRAIGNSLEVKEAIDALKGKGPEDLMQVCMALAGNMLIIAGKAGDMEEAESLLNNVIDNGKALSVFKAFVKAQGGDMTLVDDPELFGKAALNKEIRAEKEGYISRIECEEVGTASLLLGGGRRNKEDVIDPDVGIILNKKTGDRVLKDEVIATLYANDEGRLEDGYDRLSGAIDISDSPCDKYELVKETIV
ncbi:MAG: pyrimidine-nucleoside phosphorylase [Lachnospiraceae bacterium]|nr:pyrimidine-nucleoside phosphorylase [Lachnospiraceae bacterium]